MTTTYTLNTIEATLYGSQVILTHIDSSVTDRIEIRSTIHRTDRATQYFKHPTQQTYSEIEITAEQGNRKTLLFREERQPHNLPVWGEVQDLHKKITQDPQKIGEIIKFFLIQQ